MNVFGLVFSVFDLVLEKGPAYAAEGKDKPHPPVAHELLGAVLAIVYVEGVYLMGDVGQDGPDGRVEGPGLVVQPAGVQQAHPHRAREAGEADGSLRTELDCRRLDSDYDVIILVLE